MNLLAVKHSIIYQEMYLEEIGQLNLELSNTLSIICIKISSIWWMITCNGVIVMVFLLHQLRLLKERSVWMIIICLNLSRIFRKSPFLYNSSFQSLASCWSKNASFTADHFFVTSDFVAICAPSVITRLRRMQTRSIFHITSWLFVMNSKSVQY